MDDDAGFFGLAQLFLKVFELLKCLVVVLALRSVGNVHVSGNVVRDEAAGGRMCDTGEVIKCIILNELLFRIEDGSLMLDFN